MHFSVFPISALSPSYKHPSPLWLLTVLKTPLSCFVCSPSCTCDECRPWFNTGTGPQHYHIKINKPLQNTVKNFALLPATKRCYRHHQLSHNTAHFNSTSQFLLLPNATGRRNICIFDYVLHSG